MPVLDVPYFVQPTGNSCQSTVLKMFASYIDRRRGQPILRRDISDIFNKMDNDPDRPDQVNNHLGWANFRWWLEQEFSDMQFIMNKNQDAATSIQIIRKAISDASPILVSTNQNMLNSGHIILVIGVMQYINGHFLEPTLGPIGQNFAFICHDPYGRFGKQFLSTGGAWGVNRFHGGMSAEGSEHGPGASVLYSLDGIRRANNQFLLIYTNSL